MGEELHRLRERAVLQAEARLRAPGANLFITLGYLLLAFGPLVPGVRALLHYETSPATLGAVGVAWLVYELATLSFHTLGAQHLWSRVGARLDALSQCGALLALIFLSDSAASPLWIIVPLPVIAVARTLGGQAPFKLALLVLGLGLFALTMLPQRGLGDSMMAALMLGTSVVAHLITALSAARSLSVRAEREVLERQLNQLARQNDRERMAREVHDGIGAEVMALLLRLRRASTHHPRAAQLVERAQTILDELRSVVWSLRNEQGTLGELGKLIDARTRLLRRKLGYGIDPVLWTSA